MIGVFSKHTGRLISFQPNQAENETDQHGYCPADIGVDEVEIEDKACPQGTCNASQADEGVAQSLLRCRYQCEPLLVPDTLIQPVQKALATDQVS